MPDLHTVHVDSWQVEVVEVGRGSWSEVCMVLEVAQAASWLTACWKDAPATVVDVDLAGNC